MKILIPIIFAILIAFTACDENTTGPAANGDYDEYLLSLYDPAPDLDNCYPGELADAEKSAVLSRVNYIRTLHGLAPVSYDYSNDIYVQAAAILGAVNENLTHYPEQSDICYSEEGDLGASSSNLALWFFSRITQWSSTNFVDVWISEKNSVSIGHRRWTLNPFMKSISFGRVDRVTESGRHYSSAAMWVFDEGSSANTNADFVAFPYGDYPASAVEQEGFCSFSVLVDKNNIAANADVDFSGASITVTAGGQNVAVTDVSYDNEYQGLKNSLKWRIVGFQFETEYDVEIDGVTAAGSEENYSYSFKVTSSVTKPDLAVPEGSYLHLPAAPIGE